MKNKPQDIPYCGCDKKKIKTANPKINPKLLKIYVYYQWERTNIYYLKEIEKTPPPWTQDEILKKYRFTNTRRELDKQSKWLIKKILDNPNISYENKLLNAILFRFINKFKTFESYLFHVFNSFHVNFFLSENKLNKMLSELDYIIKHEKNKQGLNNPAYMFSGVMRAINLVNSRLNFCSEKYIDICKKIAFIHYFKDDFLKIAELRPNKFYEQMKKFPVFSGSNFLIYQIWVDWTYIGAYTPNTNDFYPYSENEFVLSGPGCHRGIMWIIDNNPRNLDGLTEEEFMFWFRDNLPKLAEQYKLKWNSEKMFHFLSSEQRNWGVMQIENSFCEFDKYCRTFFGKSSPKQLYKPQINMEKRKHFSNKSKNNHKFFALL